ncbi:hypothetical protein HWI79_2066 [Cryptosporidium felis]|nr:hypothetical protein HWI79_2066 [Cryptosporidium felis]
MSESDNIENLVGLLKKVERKQRKEELEKYKRVSDEIQNELNEYLVRFHKTLKKSEAKTVEIIRGEYLEQERKSQAEIQELKELELQLNRINLEYEKSKKNLQAKITRLKEMYSRQLEQIQEEERKELRNLKKEMKSMLIVAKKEAFQFSRNNVKFGNIRLVNLIKRISRI